MAKHNKAPTAPAPAATVAPQTTVAMGKEELLWRSRSIMGAATILPRKNSLSQLLPTTVITVLATTNPKKGKASSKAFACYFNGQTVAQAIAAIGKGALGHIAWDFNCGFIHLTAAEALTDKALSEQSEAPADEAQAA